MQCASRSIPDASPYGTTSSKVRKTNWSGSMSNLLEISDLRVGFERGGAMSEVLHVLNLSLKRGEALGLVGESGSGKSVAALSILRLLGRHGKITGGRIFFDGRDLARCDEQEMRKVRGRDIAMIFQDPTTALNPAL